MFRPEAFIKKNMHCEINYIVTVPPFCTVLPANSDIDVMFCLQIYQDLESIDHLCIDPIRMIGLIHK